MEEHMYIIFQWCKHMADLQVRKEPGYDHCKSVSNTDIKLILYDLDYYANFLIRSKKLNLKMYLNPGSKFTYIINYILNDYDQ